MEELQRFLEKLNADFLLLQSQDRHTKQHYLNSQLARHTGFSGSAGEAVLALDGTIYLFVDPRYHIQSDKEVKGNVKVVKLEMAQNFTDALKDLIDNTKALAVSGEHTTVKTYEKLLENFKVECAKYPDIIEDNPFCNIIKLPPELCGETTDFKLAKVLKFIEEQGADGYLVSNLADIAYLQNQRCFNMPYSSLYKAKLYIDKSAIHSYPCEIGEKVIINPQSTSMADFKTLKQPVCTEKNPLAEMASVKNKAEIEHLKVCFSRLDAAFLAFREKIKAGLSEFELKEIIESEILAKGACALSFKTILAIEENSSSIHYSACSKEKRLKEGELILLDCGSYCEGGLATDMTRVFVCGTPNDIQKTVYTRVLQAFLRAYNSDFGSGFELDECARNFLKDNAPEGFIFSHSLGHGIGTLVHQGPPVISPGDKEKRKLVSGNTFTIEPGLYCEGKFGIRLENCVYIDETGQKVSFSKFPFESALIDFTLLDENERKWLKEWLEK